MNKEKLFCVSTPTTLPFLLELTSDIKILAFIVFAFISIRLVARLIKIKKGKEIQNISLKTSLNIAALIIFISSIPSTVIGDYLLDYIIPTAFLLILYILARAFKWFKVSIAELIILIILMLVFSLMFLTRVVENQQLIISQSNGQTKTDCDLKNKQSDEPNWF